MQLVSARAEVARKADARAEKGTHFGEGYREIALGEEQMTVRSNFKRKRKDSAYRFNEIVGGKALYESSGTSRGIASGSLRYNSI
jgi:hypothetical protein